MMQVIMSRELPLQLINLLWLQVKAGPQILRVMNKLTLHLFIALCAPEVEFCCQTVYDFLNDRFRVGNAWELSI
jgi:hypothetical protein